MPNPKPRSPKWTPFNPGKKGKSYTPKHGEPNSKQHLKQYKDMGKKAK